MKKFSKELSGMVTELIVSEIGSKALDGVTYVIIADKDKDGRTAELCYGINKEKEKCGYDDSEVIRVTQVTGGMVADLDISTVKAVTMALAKESNEIDNKNPISIDLIKDAPERKREKELKSLASKIVSKHNEGEDEIDVALYNLNSGRTINVIGEQNGEKALKQYSAYALRVEDMERLNKDFLKGEGLKISEVAMGCILPSKKGISCRLKVRGR